MEEEEDEEEEVVVMMVEEGAGPGKICCGSKFRVCMACRA